MFLLLAIKFSFCSINEIKHFVDKDIRIFISNANYIFLAKDTTNDMIITRSKYSILDVVFSTFRLVKDGKEYRLFSGEQRICGISDEIVSKCETSKTW